MSAGPSPALYAPMSVWPGKSLTPASAQALPSNWQPFFDRSRDVVIPSSGDTFRVYESGVAAPGQSLLVLVHGGGHTAMSWALAAVPFCCCVRVCLGINLAEIEHCAQDKPQHCRVCLRLSRPRYAPARHSSPSNASLLPN